MRTYALEWRHCWNIDAVTEGRRRQVSKFCTRLIIRSYIASPLPSTLCARPPVRLLMHHSYLYSIAIRATRRQCTRRRLPPSRSQKSQQKGDRVSSANKPKHIQSRPHDPNLHERPPGHTAHSPSHLRPRHQAHPQSRPRIIRHIAPRQSALLDILFRRQASRTIHVARPGADMTLPSPLTDMLAR